MMSGRLGPLSGEWGQKTGTVGVLELGKEASQKVQWHPATRISQPLPH